LNSNNSNHGRAASARGFLARFAITPLAALGILAGAVPAAHAADTTCTTTISSATTINGNLVVPAGATCTLENGTTVTGNVQVGKGASLTVEPLTLQATIGGNVQADQCNFVQLIPNGPISVGGNVQIRNCTGQRGSGYSVLVGSLTISGNFACDHNSGGCVATGGLVRGNVQVDDNTNGSGNTNGNGGAEVTGNNIGGNVQVDKNSGSPGFNNFVDGNTIGGNLQCAGNTPGVTDGGSPKQGPVRRGQLLGRCAAGSRARSAEPA